MGSTAVVAVHGLNEAPAICSRGIPQAVVSFVEPPVPMAGVSGAAPCIVEGIPPLGFPRLLHQLLDLLQCLEMATLCLSLSLSLSPGHGDRSKSPGKNALPNVVLELSGSEERS